MFSQDRSLLREYRQENYNFWYFACKLEDKASREKSGR
jgi:hypothetical protein